MHEVKSTTVNASNPTATEFDKKRDRLMHKVAGYAGRKTDLVLESNFKLADQVLTHALVAADARFKLADISKGGKGDVREITMDRYGLRLARETKGPVISGKALLGGWSEADLVQYVLDHEVPVDPADMPGAIQRAA